MIPALHRGMVLEAIDGLEVVLAGARWSIVRLPGGRSLDCGPHGLAILDHNRNASGL